MLKTVVLLYIFVETMLYIFLRIIWWIEASEEQHLFEIEKQKQNKNTVLTPNY